MKRLLVTVAVFILFLAGHAGAQSAVGDRVVVNLPHHESLVRVQTEILLSEQEDAHRLEMLEMNGKAGVILELSTVGTAQVRFNGGGEKWVPMSYLRAAAPAVNFF